MISVAEAIRIVGEQTTPLTSERVTLDQARGRYLAEDVVADSDLPPFDRSQMDGYAMRASDAQTVPAKLKIVGESAAGHGWHQTLKAGEAVRIMTGADCVQQVELTRELGEANGLGEVEIQERVSPGRSIVTRGSEIRAGETVL